MAKDLNVFDKEYGLLINGVWTKPGALLNSYNPANGELLAKFTDASDADVDAAVAAAQEAFKTWRKTTTAERGVGVQTVADWLGGFASGVMAELLGEAAPAFTTYWASVGRKVRYPK